MNPTTELVLVRHAETEWMERGLLHGGRKDSPLSTKGLQQAKLTAQALTVDHFDVLYTSPQGRAVETASIIGEACSLKPQPVDGFREFKFGWLEGKPLPPHGPQRKISDQLLRFRAGLIILLSGERMGRFRDRVVGAVKTVITKDYDRRVLVVTHSGVLSMIMASLVAGDSKRWRDHWGWVVTGITELHHRDGQWRLIRQNDATHLNK